MSYCPVCQTPILDLEPTDRFCKSCGWALLDKELSDMALRWLRHSWKENQALKTEKEQLNRKVKFNLNNDFNSHLLMRHTMSLNKILKLSLSEEDILEIYKNAPKALLKSVTKVSIKEESLRKLNQDPISFTESRNGNYWLIPIQDNNYLLFPKNNLKINSYEYPTVQSLFECQGYQTEAAREFILKKPARVFLTTGGEWILEERGLLEFIIAYPATQLQSQLEQAQEDRIQLQIQLEELNLQLNKSEDEREQLLSSLNKVEQERQQLLSSLEQLSKTNQGEELFKQMHQASEERKLLLSAIQKFNDGFNRLEMRVGAIEQDLKANIEPSQTRQKNDFLNNPRPNIASTLSPPPRLPESLRHQELLESLSSSRPLKLPYTQIVVAYNSDPAFFSNDAIEVSTTEDSMTERRLGVNQAVVLQKVVKGRGNFWVLPGNYLVPKMGMKINTYKYEQVEALFLCRNYQSGATSFQLSKPAKVAPLSQGETWKLLEPGQLEF